MAVTLDYKALTMLMKRKDEENEELCKRGLDTECCVYCKVIRVGYSGSARLKSWRNCMPERFWDIQHEQLHYFLNASKKLGNC